MPEEDDSSEVIPPSQKKALGEYEWVLIERGDKVVKAFDSLFSDEMPPGKIKRVGDQLSWILKTGEQSEDDINDLINAILNTIINFGTQARAELEDIEVNADIIELFEYISINHGTELDRQANRRTKGENWWSDISTSITHKDQVTSLAHEITIDMNRNVTISNDIHGSHILANHILNQTKTARNVIGEDVLEDIDRDLLEDIQDTLTDIFEELDDFETDEETVEASIADQSEVAEEASDE